jgi:hypothetical protein
MHTSTRCYRSGYCCLNALTCDSRLLHAKQQCFACLTWQDASLQGALNSCTCWGMLRCCVHLRSCRCFMQLSVSAQLSACNPQPLAAAILQMAFEMCWEFRTMFE